MDHDILIIGGGPAGLATALFLREAAPELAGRTLILEKARYPRPKLCAGGLTADAEALLEILGLDLAELPSVQAGASHLGYGGRGLTLPSSRRHSLRMIRRDEFDAWLAAKARERGVAIRENTTVLELLPDAEGVTVRTDAGELRARVVVGADGSLGMTRRFVAPEARGATARVIEVITPERSPAGGERHGPRDAHFDFTPVPEGIAGYVWDFPTRIDGEPMRCWGAYDANFAASPGRSPLREPLREEMARSGFDLAEYRMQGHPIRWFTPRGRLAVPRVLLVGDAAGADPLFGEGIAFALGYGRVAASELRTAFENDDYSFRGYRTRLLRSSLGRALLARWFITHFLYRLRQPWLQKSFWHCGKPLILAVTRLFVMNWAGRPGPATPAGNRRPPGS